MALDERARKYVGPLIAGLLLAIGWVYFGAMIDKYPIYTLAGISVTKVLASAALVLGGIEITKKL